MSGVVLVFGCTGQDGSLLCKSLLKKGYEVVGVSRSVSPNLSIHKSIKIYRSIHLETIDICDFRSVLGLIENYQPCEVYNLSAQSSVSLSFVQPAKTCESIVTATVNLLEVARYAQYDGRLFFAGSSEIFGNTDTPAQIGYRTDPVSPYAVAKEASMKFVRVYREAYGLNCVTGVLFNHESPFRPETYVTQKIIRGAMRCKSDESFKLHLGNLSIARDWGWAEEYVEAVQILTRSDRLTDQIVCSGKMVPLRYFVSRVFEELDMNWKDKVVHDKHFCRPTDIMKSVGDPTPMQVTHNWRATIEIDEIISKLLEAGYKS